MAFANILYVYIRVKKNLPRQVQGLKEYIFLFPFVVSVLKKELPLRKASKKCL